MLRKTRRAPLQGSVNEQGVKQKVPFKRNLLKEIHAELTDDESRAPPSNFELTAAMMHRIILLEKTGGGDREQDTPPARSFSMNFDLVLQKIQDLNVLTGEGQRFIHKTASGAKLYRNGIEMFDGHFRSFQEQSTQLCMQDLVDDCFPSELQQRFPDGVPFEEEADHRSEKAAKDGGQSRCGDRHQEFSEGDCRFRLILGAQRLLWTHLVAEGRYSAVKEHLLKLSSR
ncbi:uncharacterized protein ubxn11 isoform X2 [Nothobranchius furzeri]|uniref:UBX domain-containing protein 11 n=1 Tax=Nothobranchius furzeri TaxID=105023 RepID=A0A1A7ZKL0_NOTFU|nr:uncharacterized protein ubxn11 isoform X3 [Nothobranchius furzeri]KAF7227545.1 transcript variant X3 [Nothobranchius furzeri]